MSHLTTGTREMGGGLERYTFEVALTGIAAAADRRGRRGLQEFFADVYCTSPRPDPREIIDFKITPLRDTARVELLIQRGHYRLLQWLREHEGDLTIRADGLMKCSCHPDRSEWLLRDQLPSYVGEF